MLLIRFEQIRSQHACSFYFCSLVLKAESSLFEAHIWPKKNFQKQERNKIALENFHKFAFTSKKPFLCNMFALDFISWGNVVYTQRTTSENVSVSGLFLSFFVWNEICPGRSLYMVK